VLTFSRRFSAVFLALALAAGQTGACAGWMPTAEARMACCSDDGPCRMHKSESESDGSKRVVSQAEADRCCAAAERDDSASSPSNFAFSVTLAVVISPVAVLIQEPEAHANIWRASVPIPAANAPKHLLLSVFLV
jgi:hypothetical protein